MKLTKEEQVYLFDDYNKCICNEGIHNGERVDCKCQCCKEDDCCEQTFEEFRQRELI